MGKSRDLLIEEKAPILALFKAGIGQVKIVTQTGRSKSEMRSTGSSISSCGSRRTVVWNHLQPNAAHGSWKESPTETVLPILMNSSKSETSPGSVDPERQYADTCKKWDTGIRSLWQSPCWAISSERNASSGPELINTGLLSSGDGWFFWMNQNSVFQL